MQRSTEDFERDVCVNLGTLLPAALTAMNALYLDADRSDGLADPDGTSWVAQQMTAPDPQLQVGYFPGGLDVVTAWPSIEAAVPDLLLSNFSIGQTDADAELRLIVQIHLKEPRFPVLNRLMKRYGAAVYDVLKTQGVLGDASIREARFAWRTNPEAPESDDRIKAGVLIFLTLETAQVRA